MASTAAAVSSNPMAKIIDEKLKVYSNLQTGMIFLINVK
jgi:hypothetical protein